MTRYLIEWRENDKYTAIMFDTYDQAEEYCEENYLAKSLIKPIDR